MLVLFGLSGARRALLGKLKLSEVAELEDVVDPFMIFGIDYVEEEVLLSSSHSLASILAYLITTSGFVPNRQRPISSPDINSTVISRIHRTLSFTSTTLLQLAVC